jgi:hypothetical protein
VAKGGAMKYTFSDPLASFIERHLELQRALGFQQRNAAYTLAAFDRCLIAHFPKAQQVTRPMVAEFLKTTGHLQTNTRSMRLSYLRSAASCFNSTLRVTFPETIFYLAREEVR